MWRLRLLALIITFLLALVLDLAGYLFWQAGFSWIVLWFVGLNFAAWLTGHYRTWLGVLVMTTLAAGLFYGNSTILLLANCAAVTLIGLFPQLQRRIPPIFSFCLGFLSLYVLGWRVLGTIVPLGDIVLMTVALMCWSAIANRLFSKSEQGYAV